MLISFSNYFAPKLFFQRGHFIVYKLDWDSYFSLVMRECNLLKDWAVVFELHSSVGHLHSFSDDGVGLELAGDDTV